MSMPMQGFPSQKDFFAILGWCHCCDCRSCAALKLKCGCCCWPRQANFVGKKARMNPRFPIGGPSPFHRRDQRDGQIPAASPRVTPGDDVNVDDVVRDDAVVIGLCISQCFVGSGNPRGVRGGCISMILRTYAG
jgi:hypothetical protein